MPIARAYPDDILCSPSDAQSANGDRSPPNSTFMNQNPTPRFFVGDRVVAKDTHTEMEVKGFNLGLLWCQWIEQGKPCSRLLSVDSLRLAPRWIETKSWTVTAGMPVRHCSGGPVLTVVEIVDGQAWCEWRRNGRALSHDFPVAELLGVVDDAVA